MSLRVRLVVTLLGLSIPLVAGAVWLQGRLDEREANAALIELVRTRMEASRDLAEADPERFPPDPRRTGPSAGPPGRRGDPRGARPPEPGPRLELFAYRADYTSDNPRAPRFPPELRDRLESGERSAARRATWDGRPHRFAAVRMDWDTGPCVLALGWRPLEPRRLSANQAVTAASVALGLVAAVFLAAGPLIVRLRRLRDEVRASSESGYTSPVTIQGTDEIDQLAGEFERAAGEVRSRLAEVKDRERALRDFVSDTTHDVMIPMTVLQGHLIELRESSQADPETLGDAIGEVQYVTSLLRNLATTAKLAAGEFEPDLRPIDLGELVERVVARFTPLARERSIELNHGIPETPLLVRGDVTLLEQAVGNLVHNALRYGNPGGHAAVLVERSSPSGFTLRVIDDGPGIAPERIADLSARAARSDEARARQPDGQGLGLSIAFSVARAHGFDLDLSAAEPGGLEAVLRGGTTGSPA